jgi:hypothetical protein
MYVPTDRSITEHPMPRHLAGCLAVLLLSAACGRAKEAARDAVAADTTATPAAATPLVDSTGSAPNTEAAPSAPTATPVRPGATSSTRGGATPAPSPYIGRDSAFGPTYEVDSTGKVTPIRVKKPVNR